VSPSSKFKAGPENVAFLIVRGRFCAVVPRLMFDAEQLHFPELTPRGRAGASSRLAEIEKVRLVSRFRKIFADGLRSRAAVAMEAQNQPKTAIFRT
jgi:hypothetical protein